jgi:hypothetical protein
LFLRIPFLDPLRRSYFTPPVYIYHLYTISSCKPEGVIYKLFGQQPDTTKKEHSNKTKTTPKFTIIQTLKTKTNKKIKSPQKNSTLKNVHKKGEPK